MYRTEQADCFEWLRNCPPHSFHAVCTDPPYGILEFTGKELAKLRAGRGGVWRLPPKVGGNRRDPLPRFTVLTDEQKQHLRDCCSTRRRVEPFLICRTGRPPGHARRVCSPKNSWRRG
jgi:hypothetical protein